MPDGPGHALNKILKDIINRFHVSIGHRVQSVKRVPISRNQHDLVRIVIFLGGIAMGYP